MIHVDDTETTQITNALKRAVNARQGWDLPPEWGHIFRADNGRMRCSPLPVPLYMWRQGNGDPKNVLRGYQELLTSPNSANQRNAAAALRATIPDSLVGMYIVTEGWAPPPHRVRAVEAARARGERVPRFKDMPDRVELRQACAVDVDRRLYMVSQPRNTMVLDGAVDDLGPEVTLAGAIPNLLLSILFSALKDRARA